PLRDVFLNMVGQDLGKMEVWGVPLMHVGHLYGLVLCLRKKDRKLSSHLQTSLETLALGSSIAIRNALEFESMRQKSVALSTVHSVYRLMSSTRVASDLLHRMANLTLQVLNAKKCSIMLADQNGRLHPCVALGLQKGEIGTQSLDPGEGIPGLVADEGVSLRVQKPRDDPRFSLDPPDYYLSESYLSVPLFEEDVVGVITVSERMGSPNHFTVGDREVLNTLAEQAVIALMNIQYFEKQERIALKTMGTFENLFETGDPDKEGRSQKLASLMSGIAESIRIDEHTRQNFQMAAFLHSLGTLGTGVGENGEPLSASEESTKRVAMGIRMARRMDLPDNVIPIIRDQLEHFDGSGGPRGLRGDEIPLGARL
ncbi:MAG: GAF domain-containing protein, partial [Candidatus Omnitrophica bacterium]|nr:GAF domain-containing protein [Candidatus Omnitrophota bacterium]